MAEQTLVRLDTDATAVAIYVGGHALLGVAVAWPVHAIVRGRVPAAARAVLIAAVLLAIDLLLYTRLWGHRSLPLSAGVMLLAAGGA
ncbi:hypothetical protein K8I85_02570, partial [bacterium]|nr:hypothetical protein [bacterium]